MSMTTLLFIVTYAGAVMAGAAIGFVISGAMVGAREDDRARGRE